MKPFGLGDLAFYLFRPTIYLIDFVFGSDMRNCDVCKERRKLWNSWFSRPSYVWLAFVALIVVIISTT